MKRIKSKKKKKLLVHFFRLVLFLPLISRSETRSRKAKKQKKKSRVKGKHLNTFLLRTNLSNYFLFVVAFSIKLIEVVKMIGKKMYSTFSIGGVKY